MQSLAASAEIEASNPSPFQNRYHLWNGEEAEVWLSDRQDEFSNPEPEIRSPYYNKIRKIISAPPYKQLLDLDKGGKYKINMNFDRLLHADIVQTLPKVALKDGSKEKYQIRWIDNLLHYIIGAATTTYGSIYQQTVSSKIYDVYQYAFIKDNYELYNHNIGNRSELTEWSDVLPVVNDLTMELPFPYSEDTSKAVPLNVLRNVQNELYIKLDQISDFKSLLQVQEKIDNSWKLIVLTDEFIKEHLIIQGEAATENNQIADLKKIKELAPAMVYGYYAKFSEKMSEEDAKNDCSMEIQEFMLDKHPNAVNSGETIVHNIKIKDAVKCFFVLPENNKSAKFNVRSNYTTEPQLKKLGNWPIKRYGINNGKMPRSEMIDASANSRSIGMRYFKVHDPTIKGIIISNHSYYPMTSEPDNMIVFTRPDSQMDLIIEMRAADPMIQYNIHVVYKAQRNITFRNDKKNPIIVEYI